MSLTPDRVIRLQTNRSHHKYIPVIRLPMIMPPTKILISRALWAAQGLKPWGGTSVAGQEVLPYLRPAALRGVMVVWTE